jgi:hypothetical protein
VIELRGEPLATPAQRAVDFDQLVLPITDAEDFFRFPVHTEHYANEEKRAVQRKNFFATGASKARCEDNLRCC